MLQRSLKIGTFAGLTVYVNWTWLIAFGLITWSLGLYYIHNLHLGTTTAYVTGAVDAVFLFIAVLLHEMGHSFVARARNLPVHSITLWIFGGVSNLTQEPRNPRTELVVAIAGPIVSLIISGIFFALFPAAGSWPVPVTASIHYLAAINLLLALFNLIPAFPLDGGRVLHSVLWVAMHNLRKATHIASQIGEGFGILFILAGIFEAFFLGDIVAGIWLAFIGWFLHSMASSSYQQQVMSLALRGVTVSDVMQQPPPTASASESVGSVVHDYFLDRNQRAVPVTGPNDRLLGLTTVSDVGQVPRNQWDVTPVSQAMTPATKLHTVTPDEPLMDAVQTLAQDGLNQLPVVQAGRLAGMLNRAHVLHYLSVRQQLGVQELPGGQQNQPPQQRAS